MGDWPEWLVTTLSLFILLALAGALISPIFCKMDDGKDP